MAQCSHHILVSRACISSLSVACETSAEQRHQQWVELMVLFPVVGDIDHRNGRMAFTCKDGIRHREVLPWVRAW